MEGRRHSEYEPPPPAPRRDSQGRQQRPIRPPTPPTPPLSGDPRKRLSVALSPEDDRLNDPGSGRKSRGSLGVGSDGAGGSACPFPGAGGGGGRGSEDRGAEAERRRSSVWPAEMPHWQHREDQQRRSSYTSPPTAPRQEPGTRVRRGTLGTPTPPPCDSPAPGGGRRVSVDLRERREPPRPRSPSANYANAFSRRSTVTWSTSSPPGIIAPKKPTTPPLDGSREGSTKSDKDDNHCLSRGAWSRSSLHPPDAPGVDADKQDEPKINRKYSASSVPPPEAFMPNKQQPAKSDDFKSGPSAPAKQQKVKVKVENDAESSKESNSSKSKCSSKREL